MGVKLAPRAAECALTLLAASLAIAEAAVLSEGRKVVWLGYTVTKEANTINTALYETSLPT